MKLTVTTTRTGKAGPILKALQGKMLENAKVATQTVAKMLLVEATDLAPHDTGALKASGYVSEEATVEATGLVVSTFGFGKEGFVYTGPDKKGVIRTRKPFDYAIWVHNRIAPAQDGKRFDFMHVALELKTMEIRFRVREIMKRT